MSDQSISRSCLHLLSKNLHDFRFTDLRDYPPVWVNDREIEDYPQIYQSLYKQLKESEAIIFGFPIYNYSAGSPVKVITEIMDDALDNKVISFCVAAGGVKSFLASTDFAKSLRIDFDAILCPKHLFATKSDFSLEDNLPSCELEKRILDFSNYFEEFVKRVAQ